MSGQAHKECAHAGTRLTLVPESLKAWQIKGVLTGLGLAALLVGASWLPFAPELLTANLVLICLLCLAPPALEAVFLDPLRHKHYSLCIHPDRLVISQGVAFRQTIIIPRSSILNMRLRRGPVLRRLGLTGVSILTIADQHRIGPFDAAQTGMVEDFLNGAARDLLP
ncbi:MAG: PH domain-containing protein [Coriobacteriia bacterium]|nr:PH domain-containing protein [Coriobacteriia bacterium]